MHYNYAMENNKAPETKGFDSVRSTTPTPTQEQPSSFWKGLGDLAGFVIGVLAVVIIVRVFIAQPFIVSGTSMVPTFQNSNYLIVDEVSYRFHEPQRGDVIIFHPPIEMSSYYIKRIIGLPGDTVTVQNGVVTVSNKDHPAGMILTEPYITTDTLAENVTTVVPAGQYFVMGDNRPASFDSRKWGLLPKQNIVGRALVRLFPFSGFAILPGEHMITL